MNKLFIALGIYFLYSITALIICYLAMLGDDFLIFTTDRDDNKLIAIQYSYFLISAIAALSALILIIIYNIYSFNNKKINIFFLVLFCLFAIAFLVFTILNFYYAEKELFENKEVYQFTRWWSLTSLLFTILIIAILPRPGKNIINKAN
jgi:hypothetical protein